MPDTKPISVIMAVPTVYAQLVEEWESWAADRDTKKAKATPKGAQKAAQKPEAATLESAGRRARARGACDEVRLMVCGSAALPLATLNRWQKLSGHVLLERYGMTEFAMALSNPLDPKARQPGCLLHHLLSTVPHTNETTDTLVDITINFTYIDNARKTACMVTQDTCYWRMRRYVGVPLPSVEVAICQSAAEAEEAGAVEASGAAADGGSGIPHVLVLEGEAGEVRVRGPALFTE